MKEAIKVVPEESLKIEYHQLQNLQYSMQGPVQCTNVES